MHDAVTPNTANIIVPFAKRDTIDIGDIVSSNPSGPSRGVDARHRHQSMYMSDIGTHWRELTDSPAPLAKIDYLIAPLTGSILEVFC